MSIAANSRYADNSIVTLNVGGASRQVIAMSEPGVTTFSFFTHTYSADETIDNIAYSYLGDPTQWWQIADANPEVMDWNNLTPGYPLRIPVGAMTSTP
jgi:nucleoid-associated protein YgaU